MLCLILLNGVFSGAEIAILSLRRTRLQELVDSGSRGALAVAALRKDPERFLATVQVGITVIGATAAAFGGSSVAARLAPLIRSVPGLEQSADQVALAVVVAGVSYLSLVLGELVPKSLALRAGETYALLVGRPLAWVAWVARPLVWLLTATSNVFLRLFGDRTSFVEARLSSDELRQLVDEAATAGTVDRDIGEIAVRALEFSDRDVESVMVPRRDVVAVEWSSSVHDLAQLACTHGHTRVLVYEREPDNVLGFVNVRDALARGHVDPQFTLADALHPVPFVPATVPAPKLLRDLQQQRTHLAAVVDEQGTLMGIVTIEDLVEELVGDILSERDTPRNELRQEADGSVLAPASLPVRDVVRATGFELPERDGYTTLAGLVIHHAGRIPAPGDRVQEGDIELEVVEATHRRIKLVRLRPMPARVDEPAS